MKNKKKSNQIFYYCFILIALQSKLYKRILTSFIISKKILYISKIVLNWIEY